MNIVILYMIYYYINLLVIVYNCVKISKIVYYFVGYMCFVSIIVFYSVFKFLFPGSIFDVRDPLYITDTIKIISLINNKIYIYLS
jgi:hypothetical protein